MLAIWTKGPSLPRGMPLPRAHVSPITLATKVFRVRYSFRTTPRRMVFISGIPEPTACGARIWVKPAEKVMSTVG